jgi:hypothetical protein
VTGSVSPPTGEETVWRRADHAAYVDSGERVVVLDLDHLGLPPYIFEGTAAAVWASLDGDLTEAEIVSELAAAYQVQPPVVAVDVRQFVDRLRALGLVVAGA